MRFKIDWASFIVESKFIVFALFYFVFEGNFPSTSPQGGLYLEGLIHGGAYFRNFKVRSETSLLYDKCIINLDFHVRHFCARDPYIR